MDICVIVNYCERGFWSQTHICSNMPLTTFQGIFPQNVLSAYFLETYYHIGICFSPFSTLCIFHIRVVWDPVQANLMDAIAYLARSKYVSVPRGWDTRPPVEKALEKFQTLKCQTFSWAGHISPS